MSTRGTFSVAAEGIIGLGLEATRNTYKAPNVFLPITSESFMTQESNVYRRLLQNTADPVNVKAGNQSHEGTIEMEALHNIMPYFMLASRGEITKTTTGTSTKVHTYTLTPKSFGQLPNRRTLSVTIVRAGVVFAYTGCVVSSFSMTTSDGLLNMSYTMLASDEKTQALPKATWPDTIPFGAGEYKISIPSDTQVYDADTFTFNVNDNAENQFRLQDERRGPWFIKYGERTVDLDIERDFNSRKEFDDYKNQTSNAVKIEAITTDTPPGSVTIDLNSAIVDSFDVSLSGGQGDLIRASTSYMGVGAEIYTLKCTTGTADILLGGSEPYGWSQTELTGTKIVGTFEPPEFKGLPGANDSYAVTLSASDTFSSPITSGVTVAGDPSADGKATVSITGLTASTKYYLRCRVVAKTVGGVTSKASLWSDTVEFTTTA